MDYPPMDGAAVIIGVGRTFYRALLGLFIIKNIIIIL